MRENIHMVLAVACICVLAGFSLAFVKQSTEPIIEQQVLTFVKGPAIRSVCAKADNQPIEERQQFSLEQHGQITVFPYKVHGKLVGIALEASGKGYGGDIGVMVGFDVHNDLLLGIGITQMQETPGLGSLIAENAFTAQFAGSGLQPALKTKGGRIDAVSGATISSGGAVSAVNDAAKIYRELKPRILQTWP